MKKNLIDYSKAAWDLAVICGCFLFWYFVLMCAFTGCAGGTATNGGRDVMHRVSTYPAGTVEFRSNHSAQVMRWAAKYDTVIVYGETLMFIITPQTDQMTARYYEDLSDE